MLKDYFNDVRNKAVVPDKVEMKKKAINLIKSDIELNIKSPNYYAAAFTSKVQQEAYIKKFEQQ